MMNNAEKPQLTIPRVSGSTDWSGNKNSIYKTLGASNHTDKERQSEDYYATEPKAVELLIQVIWFLEVTTLQKNLFTKHYQLCLMV